ncbi:MAG: hypothetical protein IPK16_09170 [Anaerolineales bacterium]|nr:hypothetical protein [Anaerolineales bacterium]
MSLSLDEAAAVRTGEAIDAERLGAHLREQAPGLAGAISVKQFPSGYSNLTYLVAVGEREFVLRRPPFGANIRGAVSDLTRWRGQGRPGAVGLSSFPGALRRGDVAARYAARSGRDVSGIVYYYVFGLFKIAVIAQQIYHRFRQGLTQDARFSHLDQVVTACARTAQQAATTGKIED